MKEISTSKKVGEKYETMISLKNGKYGFQLALTPTFQKELYNWIKSQDGTYFNMNVKEWNDNPQEAQSYAKATGADYVVDDLDDEVPMF